MTDWRNCSATWWVKILDFLLRSYLIFPDGVVFWFFWNCTYVSASQIFERLKLESPKFYKKIELIEGNCEQENLGLTPTDRYLISQNTTVIFHCAANVKFDNDLKTEININVFGAVEVMKLAKLVRNLKVCTKF